MMRLLRSATNWASAINAKVPPSPLKSARRRTKTYLSVTSRSSDHTISERMPSTVSWVTMPSPVAATAASRKA